MKKYIFTESQIKSVVDNIMNEQLMLEQRGQILKLKDLADMCSRTKAGDYETFLQIFIDVFKDEGDQGVINLFKSATNLKIEDMGYGRYMLK